jgi:hypothetical protein
MCRAAAILNATLLAGAATLAGASPSAEWAEQLQLLEARFEGKLTVLQQRVVFLEGEMQQLRARNENEEPIALDAATGAPQGKPPQEDEPAVLNSARWGKQWLCRLGVSWPPSAANAFRAARLRTAASSPGRVPRRATLVRHPSQAAAATRIAPRRATVPSTHARSQPLQRAAA